MFLQGCKGKFAFMFVAGQFKVVCVLGFAQIENIVPPVETGPPNIVALIYVHLKFEQPHRVTSLFCKTCIVARTPIYF